MKIICVFTKTFHYEIYVNKIKVLKNSQLILDIDNLLASRIKLPLKLIVVILYLTYPFTQKQQCIL